MYFPLYKHVLSDFTLACKAYFRRWKLTVNMMLAPQFWCRMMAQSEQDLPHTPLLTSDHPHSSVLIMTCRPELRFYGGFRFQQLGRGNHYDPILMFIKLPSLQKCFAVKIFCKIMPIKPCLFLSNIFLQPEMVHSSWHAISQLVGHTCAWRRVQISVWKSEEAVKPCKSLNEACAGLVRCS